VSSERQQANGVHLGLAESVSGTRAQRTTGRVAAIENATYPLVAGVEARVREVHGQTAGTLVRKNEVLASLYAPEFLISAQAYLIALNGTDAVARQAADLGRPEQGRTADGRARLVVPLSTEGRAAGYVEFTAPLRRRFREAEVALASLLAGQAAAALERTRAFRVLQNRSATDTLTGLYSRWYFYERLYAEIARARRYRQPLALVLAELDAEEELARRRGPAFRDAVLVAMARLLQTSLRDKVDIACRLGGGRFALLLPSTLPGPDAAGLVAERIRMRVAATRLSDDDLGELGRFTMSLGVAGFPDAAEDADDLAGVAGERLAVAVAGGGDRLEPPLPEPEEEDEESGAPEDEPA
jgi:diguanylate cyclase (GGDEF)-like protein